MIGWQFEKLYEKAPESSRCVSHLLIKKVSKSQLHPAFFLSLFLLLNRVFFLILEEDINTIYINNIKNKENFSIKRQHMGIVCVHN